MKSFGSVIPKMDIGKLLINKNDLHYILAL